jgi:hypothetical protein
MLTIKAADHGAADAGNVKQVGRLLERGKSENRAGDLPAPRRVEAFMQADIS